MQHLTVKAVVTSSTDLGEFSAVISTETPDREGDVVRADAMVTALKAWNRPIPLTWHHSTSADDVFGSIDPQSARNTNGEVFVDGHVDLESDRGKTAWPLMKAGVLGFSYGYLIPEGGSKDIDGGGREITAIDVFEVTGTITPMNNDTRVIDAKSFDQLEALTERLTDLEERLKALVEKEESRTPTRAGDDLKRRSRQAVLDIQSDGASLRKPPEEVKAQPVPQVGSHLDLKRASRREMLEALIGETL